MIITTATSVDAQEGSRKVETLSLLPDEDLALLPAPDRIDRFRVQS
ncbi:MAG: hypothetical protein JWP07_3981 [Pseudonocardiales bacterium]|jgi:hypothetical protein|nr:hypothetical protein [Pseudonocardiales bacterium]